MSKRKNVFIFSSIISLFSVFSLVGSGFALWQFNEGSGYSEKNVNVEVADVNNLGKVHVHAPSIFVLESDMGTISTYGGLAFYMGGDDLSSSHFGEEDDRLSGDNEKLFASVIVGLDEVGENASLTNFKVIMDITLNGFIKNIISYDSNGDGIINNNDNSSTYTFTTFTERTNNDPLATGKSYMSESLCLDGRFLFNDYFDNNYRISNSHEIDLTKLKDDIGDQGLGSIDLSFTIEF